MLLFFLRDILPIFSALWLTLHCLSPQLALIVRDLLPDGSRRAAVVKKTFGEDADTIGLEVPMCEAGTHTLTLQVAKVVDGEYVEVFSVEERQVMVTNPPAPVLAENEDMVLCGVDTPTDVQGCMRVIVAVQRKHENAPRDLCLIARNVLPDGTRRSAVVRKIVQGTEAQTIGIQMPMASAGQNWVEFSVCECTEEGNIEIFFIPARPVTVTNPPAPRIDQKSAVVLCGIDVCGARWPDLRSEPVVDGTGRIIIAVSRTWDDAPTEFILSVHDLTNDRCARVFKSIKSCDAETLSLQVPMTAFATLLVCVSAQCHDGSVRTLFKVPVVDVDVQEVVTKVEEEKEALPGIQEASKEVELAVAESEVDFSDPEMVDEDEEEVEIVMVPVVREETVALKVGYHEGETCEASVIRRLSVTMGVDANGNYVDARNTLVALLTRAFKTEVDASSPTGMLPSLRLPSFFEIVGLVRYTHRLLSLLLGSDALFCLLTVLCDGSGVVVNSDSEVSCALRAPSKGGVVRLSLRQ